MGSICTVRVCIGLLSGLDLLFGLRGCRVYVGLFSGLDLLFGFRGCRVYVGFVVWASWVSGARRGVWGVRLGVWGVWWRR